MTITLANQIASTAQDWTVIVQIEGVGMHLTAGELTTANSDGRIRFCNQVPSYASGDKTGLWRDYLGSFPVVLSERVGDQGGFPELGAIQFSIVDVDDYLTGLLRLEANGVTDINADHAAADTTVDVGDGTQVTDDTLIWVGAECMRVDSISSNQLTVVRGYAGTVDQAHDDNEIVYAYPQFIRGRRVEIKIAPTDGAYSDESSVGTWVIDGMRWDQPLNTWIFTAKAELKYLHRAAPADPDPPKTVRQPVFVNRNGVVVNNFFVEDDNLGDFIHWDSSIDDVNNFIARISEELYVIRMVASGSTLGNIHRRGVGGTSQEDFEEGDKLYRVMAAHHEYGSFRFSPRSSPSTSRTTGTWTQSAHWLDIIANILMSSPDRDTDYISLAAARNDSYGNYASLPPGYGIGLPAAKFDWVNWNILRARTWPDWVFPNFNYGHERVPFGELIDHNFLKPLGAYFTISDGEARIVLPKTPLTGASTLSIGHANILTQEVGGGALPRLNVSYGIGSENRSIVYLLGPDKVELQVNSDGLGAQRKFYVTAEKPLAIEVPGASESNRGFLESTLVAKLRRQHSPHYSIDVDTDMASNSVSSGDLIDITLSEAPDLANGTRDWSSILAEVKENTVKLDEEFGAYRAMRLTGYGPAMKVGKITPAAYIESVSVNTATCTQNRYTHSDAPGGLPTTDAAAFVVGDVVMLRDPDGAFVYDDTETVDSISSNDIELSGDFNGNMVADHVLVYAAHDGASTTQKASWTWQADAVDGEVDTGVEPWRYSEP